MILPFTNQIWFYPKVIDFRKQLNGLMMLVIDTLGRNPDSGYLFIFRDRAGKKLKMIYFNGQCFWLLSCRLEQGRFKILILQPWLARWKHKFTSICIANRL